jgi:hypothetical protein
MDPNELGKKPKTGYPRGISGHERTKMSKCGVCGWAAVLLCSIFTSSPASAVVNGIPAPNSDHRFDAVGLFMTVPAGVTPCAGWVSGSCTLIGPNLVLLARHSLDITTSDPIPDLGTHHYRVRFRRAVSGDSENSLYVNGNSCHGTYQEFDVTSLLDAPNRSCDQVLAFLDRVPVGINPIGLELANPPLAPTDAILAGWGLDGQCPGTGNPEALRIARGVLPGNWSGSDYLTYSPCIVTTVAPCLSCTGTGPFMIGNLHDSGGAVLIEVPSSNPQDPTPELRLVGTVSSPTLARRPSAWNNSGGLPQLLNGTSAHALKSDFDGDGVVTIQDLLEFLQAFFAGSPDADFNGNGVPDSGDVLAFVAAWLNQQ